MKNINNPSQSEIYDYSKQKGLLLHVGFIKIKRLREIIPTITYRKINDWDEKNLLSSSRNKVSGWRVFSILDIIKIQIISDLREFGFRTNTIRTALNNISNASLFVSNKNISKNKKSGLEYIVFSSMLGQKVLLEIYRDGKISLLRKGEAIKTRFLAGKASSPILVLPLYAYIEKIVNSVKPHIKKKTEANSKGLVVSGKS